MTHSEWGAFQRKANSLGRWAQHADGRGRWGEVRPRGGVALLVDKRLKISQGPSCVGDDAQVSSAWIENWRLSTFYAPRRRVEFKI